MSQSGKRNVLILTPEKKRFVQSNDTCDDLRVNSLMGGISRLLFDSVYFGRS